MSELSQRLVEEARSWKGTKFQHLGQLKGKGVDCANFVALVARDAGVEGVEIPHNYRPREDGTVMLKLLREHMEMIDKSEMGPGDVLALCEVGLMHLDIPRHLVFVSEVRPATVFIIHATESGVREHRTNGHWLKRIHSVWRLK
jgi:hypothetical protein